MSKSLVTAFHNKLVTLDRIRHKQEVLLRRRIGIRDIEEVYGAIFLNAIASFEGFLEEFFIDLLVGTIRKKHCNVRIKIRSYSVARDIAFRGKPYFNWLPYSNTKEIAKTFFTGGRPFTLITKDEEDHLDNCLLIRNAIAHQSRHAINRFENEVLKNLTLGPRDRRPKSLLRCQFSLTPSSTYYQQYVGKILIIANKLC